MVENKQTHKVVSLEKSGCQVKERTDENTKRKMRRIALLEFMNDDNYNDMKE